MHATVVRAVIVTICAFFTISLLAVSASASPAAPRPVPHHAAAVAATTVAAVAVTRRHTVRRGETLGKIARRVLGSARLWPVLWWDNRYKITNPDMIRAGQHIRYGHWHRLRPWLLHRALAAIPKPPPPPVHTTAVVHHHHARYHAPAAAPAQPAHYSGGSGFQACVIARESGGNPSAVNPSSGAGGLYQFLPSTWASLGYASSYPGGAQTAPVSVQNAAFWKLYGEAGTSPWAPYDGC